METSNFDQGVVDLSHGSSTNFLGGGSTKTMLTVHFISEHAKETFVVGCHVAHVFYSNEDTFLFHVFIHGRNYRHVTNAGILNNFGKCNSSSPGLVLRL